jgi:hypothetical protein
MSEKEMYTFPGPGVMEVSPQGGETAMGSKLPLKIIVFSATFSPGEGKDKGKTIVIVFASNVYNFYLKESEISLKDGVYSFSFQGADYVLRTFTDEDYADMFFGVPVDAKLLTQIMKIDEEGGADVRVSVLREKDSTKVDGFMLYVGQIGVFSRKDKAWSPVEEDFSGEMIKLSSAGKLISFWEEGNKILEHQINNALVKKP